MSNELTVIKNTNLPDAIGDLAKFILVGREKLNSVKAEIRAITKLKLAEDVRKQKQEEATMLSEAMLDAETKIGELLKKIPKNPGKRTDLEPTRTAAGRLKTKTEIVEDMGLSEDQAQRFEVLADNPDVVEFVKAEARENDDVPTRTRVLEIVSRKKKNDEDDYGEYYDRHVKICNELNRIIESINKFAITAHRINALSENFDGASKVGDTIKYIEGAREKLLAIITELRKADKYSKQA
jgi:hypothetical protein